MGYSAGGIITVYAAFAYPNVYTRFAALSSSVALWKDDVANFMFTVEYKHSKRIYMDVWTNEFGRFTKKEEFILGAEMLYKQYLEMGIDQNKIKYNIYPGATHSQICWKLRFPDALRWIFPEY